MLSRLGVLLMHLLGRLPLAWVRALGHGLGWARQAREIESINDFDDKAR